MSFITLSIHELHSRPILMPVHNALHHCRRAWRTSTCIHILMTGWFEKHQVYCFPQLVNYASDGWGSLILTSTTDGDNTLMFLDYQVNIFVVIGYAKRYTDVNANVIWYYQALHESDARNEFDESTHLVIYRNDKLSMLWTQCWLVSRWYTHYY